MKIIKIAEGLPAGWIEVEYIVGEGTIEAHVVEHGPGTACGSEDDDRLINDLLEMEFGDFGGSTVTDGGKTAEAYEEERSAKPAVVNPNLEEEEDDTFAPSRGKKNKNRQYDGGMGV